MTKKREPKSQYQIRMPKGLHRKLKSDALARGVSLNSLLVERLNRSFLMDDVAAWLDKRMKPDE